MSANPAGSSLTIEWVSRMESLERDNNKLKSQLDEIKGKYKDIAVEKKAQEREDARVARETERNLRAQQRELNQIASTIRGDVVSAIQAMGGEFLSVSGIVGLIKRGLDEVRKSAEDAGKKLFEGDPSKRSIAGYARSVTEYSAMQADVKRIMKAEGLDEPRASAIVVEAYRAGQQKSVDMLAALPDIGLDPLGSLSAYRIMSKNFGARSVGTFQTFLDQSLAAQQVTRTPAAESMSALSTIAPSVSGMTDEELGSVVSVLGQRMPSGQVGARLKNLLNKLPRLRSAAVTPPGMENLPALEFIEAIPMLESGGFIRDEKGKPTTTSDVIGRGAANTLRMIQIMQESMNQIKAVRDVMIGAGGDPGGMLRRRFNMVGADPILGAVDTAERVGGVLADQKKDKFGLSEVLSDAVLKAFEVEARRSGMGEFEIGTLLNLDRYARWRFGADEYLRGVAEQGPRMGRNVGEIIPAPIEQIRSVDPELAQRVLDYVQSMNANTDALRENTRAMHGGPASSDPRVDR